MFVQQAARQFEIWTGKPAPAGDMLRAVTIALQDRAQRSRKTACEHVAQASRLFSAEFSVDLGGANRAPCRSSDMTRISL